MAPLIPSLLDQAGKDNLTSLAILHRLANEERASRLKSAIDRCIKDARFPEVNTVDGFDFDFDVARKKLRARYLALHDLSFLAKGINPLFLGVPGTGKTFLARALTYRACQAAHRVVVTSATRMLNELTGAEFDGQLERALRRYCRAEILVSDDFAVLAMDPTQAEVASRSSPTATTTAARPASPPTGCSRTGPRCSPTRSTLRSSPSASPNTPSTSCSTGKAIGQRSTPPPAPCRSRPT